MRAALAVAALVLVFSATACGRAGVTRGDARSFTEDALRHAGLDGVQVRSAVGTCTVEGHHGWRTRAATSAGPIELCVSRMELRALSLKDDGASGQPLLDETEFARLDRYRGRVPTRRFVPAVVGAAVLLGVVVAITTYAWREEHPTP